jgi:hypothetical protein
MRGATGAISILMPITRHRHFRVESLGFFRVTMMLVVVMAMVVVMVKQGRLGSSLSSFHF